MWRRLQRKQLRATLTCKLAWALASNDDLRRQLALHSAVAAPPEDGELAQRLQLVAPALVASLHVAVLLPLARRRRNAAAHCFDVPAADIAVAGGTALNC